MPLWLLLRLCRCVGVNYARLLVGFAKSVQIFCKFFERRYLTICGMTIQQSTPILDHAIAVAGGVTALAGALGVSVPTVSTWKRRGLPTVWHGALVKRYGRRKPKAKAVPTWKPPTT